LRVEWYQELIDQSQGGHRTKILGNAVCSGGLYVGVSGSGSVGGVVQNLNLVIWTFIGGDFCIISCTL
jgi:hypothetical protein